MSYDELKKKIWKFLTAGPLFYFTVPVSIIALLIAFVASVWDGGSKLAFMVKDVVSEKASYLSKHETEILNEWVALIDYADTYEQAIDRSLQFKKAYSQLGSGIWDNNILYVRDPMSKERWMIVVDIWPGSSSCDEISSELEHLNSTANSTRALQDTLGMWLYNSRPIEFDLNAFEVTYGKVTNLPIDMEKHQKNKSGSCTENH
jgi:hypothetical protein